MAPGFFSKLVKPNSRDSSARSPSPSSPPPRQPTISVSRPSSHRPSNSVGSTLSPDHDGDTDSINPSVTVVPPSPLNSDRSISDNSSIRDKSTDELEQHGLRHKVSRRLHSLSLSNHPMPAMSPTAHDEDSTTPRPGRPSMSDRVTTVRPLSQSSSVGDLRGYAKSAESSHPRSATVATSTQYQQDLHRSPSGKSNESSRSGLRIKLTGSTSPSGNSRHDRAGMSPTMSPASTAADDDSGSVTMSPIVESPTQLARRDVGPSKHMLSTSATVPNIPNSALLSATDNSDAASVYSVSSTTKKRKLFRRLSVNKEPGSPITPTLNASQTYSQGSNKSSKRKNTGLASALAASGLAMANPAMSMPQITPSDILSRDARSNSLGSNGTNGYRSRGSVDRARSPARSQHTTLSYAGSDVSDRDSFVSGIGGGSDDDDDLDLDDIPVTGFAVASARRNQEFHELFPSIPRIGHILLIVKCLLIYPNAESALDEEAGKLLLEAYDSYCDRAKLITSIHATPRVRLSSSTLHTPD